MADRPPSPRHLVLGDAPPGLIAVACAQESTPVPYDRSRHTYLTMLTTCTDCLAVHAAWRVVFIADLDARTRTGSPPEP